MRVVYKYILELGRFCDTFSIPIDARFLTLQLQHGNISLWFDVEQDYQCNRESRKFYLAGTGQAIIRGSDVYFGTVQVDGFVWHVYEDIKEGE